MRYIVQKLPDGRFEASLMLPSGDGSWAAISQGISQAEALKKAATVARGAGKSPNKAKAITAIATAAANPDIRNLLKTQGLKAAEEFAKTLPGGGLAVQALKLAAKYGPAKRLLGKLLR